MQLDKKALKLRRTRARLAKAHLEIERLKKLIPMIEVVHGLDGRPIRTIYRDENRVTRIVVGLLPVEALQS